MAIALDAASRIFIREAEYVTDTAAVANRGSTLSSVYIGQLGEIRSSENAKLGAGCPFAMVRDILFSCRSFISFVGI